MMILPLLITSLATMNSMKTSNPVKMSMVILATGLFMFFYMFEQSSLSWIPLILSMLFTGGIIMIFMILSSVLPNEKTKKIKNLSYILPVTALILMFSTYSYPSESLLDEIKSFLTMGLDFCFLTTIILVYFIMTLSILGSEDVPMRSLACRSEINFVIW